jgi:hypothetical protein
MHLRAPDLRSPGLHHGPVSLAAVRRLDGASRPSQALQLLALHRAAHALLQQGRGPLVPCLKVAPPVRPRARVRLQQDGCI